MELRVGMQVRTLDGKLLGRVRKIGDGEFITRKGLLFRRKERIAFGEIDHCEHGTVVTRVQPEFHLEHAHPHLHGQPHHRGRR